ncbi:MAG: hypothetical protein ABI361_12980 [Nitrososphaera sp.]|jgi:hypothetical protein
MSKNSNSGKERQAAGNIIQILADLPDFVRKPMLQSRLKEFYQMDPVTKSDTIRLALSAAPTVAPAKLGVLLKTWLELLAQFDADKRTLMFHTYCQELLKLQQSEIEKLDLRLVSSVFLSVAEPARQVLKDSIHEVLLSTPNRERLLRVAPGYLLSALGLN